MLEFLLDPVPPEFFFKEYYEKRYLLIKRGQTDKYRKVLTYQELDDLMFSANLHHPHVRVVNNALENFPDPKGYTIAGSTRIDPLKYLKHYSEGSTLAMAGLQDRIFSLRRLANKLGCYFQHPFQTNIYLTPKNSQGFAPHFDTHDVFVLQFAGQKVWRIYDGVYDLPTRAMAFEKGKHDPGKLIDEFVLEQGDLLYIPRGVVHDAFCDQSSSGHVTLGLTGKTWANHLAEYIMSKVPEHQALRRYPRFHQGSDPTAEEVAGLLADLSRELLSSEQVKDDFYGKEKSISRGQLLRTMNDEPILESSLVKIGEPQQLRVTLAEESIDLKYYDTSVVLPRKCQKFVEGVLEAKSGIKLADVDCELNLEGRMLLAGEMAKNGMLEIINA